MNLRNPLHGSNKAYKKGSTLALKPLIDINSSAKQGYQWPYKKRIIEFSLNVSTEFSEFVDKSMSLQ